VQFRRVAKLTGRPCRTYVFVADVAGYALMNTMRCIPLLQALTNAVEVHLEFV
jgi:hypothetical protein